MKKMAYIILTFVVAAGIIGYFIFNHVMSSREAAIHVMKQAGYEKEITVLLGSIKFAESGKKGEEIKDEIMRLLLATRWNDRQKKEIKNEMDQNIENLYKKEAVAIEKELAQGELCSCKARDKGDLWLEALRKSGVKITADHIDLRTDLVKWNAWNEAARQGSISQNQKRKIGLFF